MADKPILFSAPMVRALLDGRKTQTRRVFKPQPPDGAKMFAWNIGDCLNFATFIHEDERGNADMHHSRIPAWRGDRLWVREAWRSMDGLDGSNGTEIAANCIEAGYQRPWAPLHYEADGARADWIAEPRGFGTKAGRYRHARFMPRWASRLTLIVTDVRVQRLQEISTDDAIEEGISLPWVAGGTLAMMAQGIAKDGFKSLWNSINGPEAWDANPWVAAYSFRVIRANIDSKEVA